MYVYICICMYIPPLLLYYFFIDIVGIYTCIYIVCIFIHRYHRYLYIGIFIHRYHRYLYLLQYHQAYRASEGVDTPQRNVFNVYF